MKMTIQKTFELTIDTSKERERIEECFNCKGNKTTYKKLLKLMDLIEAEKWKEAEAELDGKWWNGRDNAHGCSRAEFIGMLNAEGNHGDAWDTYIDLVWRMNQYPSVYKVTATEESV